MTVRGIEEIEGEIAIAGDIHAVAGDAVEAEVGGDRLAVEGKAAAGEGAGAERENVGAAARLFEALPIAQEHFEVGEQVVRPEHGLGAAHVGIAGNDGAGVHLREPEQVAHDGAEQRLQIGALFAQPHAGIERDLLVAAAAGVDLVGDVAGALLQFADDQRVDVLIGGALVEARRAGFGADLVEGFDDLGALFGGENADLLEGAREGLRAADIAIDQAAIEVE